MKLIAFCIKNFRSIVNSDWRNLANDNITGLIGQNESGKTAILEALYSFYTGKLLPDFQRSDGSLPEVSCSFHVELSEVEKIFQNSNLPKGLLKKIKDIGNRINLKRVWSDLNISQILLEEDSLRETFLRDQSVKNNHDIVQEPAVTGEVSDKEAVTANNVYRVTGEEFASRIFANIPTFEFFEDFSSLLPDTIDLEDLQSNNSEVQGFKGAKNLLAIAGINLQFLQSGDRRMVENQIERLNKSITTNFQEFWSQKIGKTNKISIEFELHHHDQSDLAKAGKPYLVFWIKDGEEKLYPKQRSKGVRWFVSFYLQLRASAQESEQRGRVFLIDEPGGSLHAKAQEDVLKVFEEIKDKVQVIYTTHSPYLIKLETLYRLLALQRADEEDDKSETLVLDIHSLGAASIDTLSPVYTLMGVDFSHQQVIQRTNNVILEEISAFYYLSSFWKLCNSSKEAHFLAATGNSNIPQLANLFLGWGLEFIVVVDDDSSGRRRYNQLKDDLFGDNEVKAREKLLKIRDCDGIEDLFSKTDFKKHILNDASLEFSSTNSEYMRSSGLSKPIAAFKFMQKVNRGELKLDDFQKHTQDKIQNLVGSLESMLG